MWIDGLQDQLKGNVDSNGILDAFKKLHDGIMLANKAMSRQIFTLMFTTLVSLILIDYRGISFFFGLADMSTSMILIMVGYLQLGIKMLLFIIFINLLSQKLQDKLVSLRQALVQINFHENQMVEIDGNWKNAKEGQLLLSDLFKEFQGFDGHGYFHLSKSLLTSTLANFVTYLIVLIQFRMSEQSAC